MEHHLDIAAGSKSYRNLFLFSLVATGLTCFPVFFSIISGFGIPHFLFLICFAMLMTGRRVTVNAGLLVAAALYYLVICVLSLCFIGDVVQEAHLEKVFIIQFTLIPLVSLLQSMLCFRYAFRANTLYIS